GRRARGTTNRPNPTMRRYFEVTRTHTYSLLFALPLLVAYEAGALLISGRQAGLRNGADVLLRTLLAAGGVSGTLGFTALLVLGAAVLVGLERRRKRVPVEGRVFGLMVCESAAYALAFGAVIAVATRILLGGMVPMQAGPGLERLPLLDGVVLSLGAGIYEELLFRVLLTGGLFAILRATKLKRTNAAVLAAVASALVFSAFHYVGAYAYPFELSTFTFRFLAGLAFSGLFIARGFGITAWTHALYDVFLVLAGAG
ncbi:MAG TPA: CPBP family glutamic-type intramembrane protease, partial [Longimicrobium sp.]|nr:CPBP family glutamic-type intramembrane protease [Longimicrobium sp.]